MRAFYLTVLQAEAEDVLGADDLMSQYQAVDQGLTAATTPEQVDAVQQQMSALQTIVARDLSADQCGHDVGSGKVITINLTYQEMVLYDDGCAVNATPVTTGRPTAPTPVGTFATWREAAPWTMISSSPPGDPLWYPETVVQWAMEFDGRGDFIHDAYWEAQEAFGPGSEYVLVPDTASIGCVQVPTAIMGWVYDWTPLGTPVIITN